jgi:hypothetical protein
LITNHLAQSILESDTDLSAKVRNDFMTDLIAESLTDHERKVISLALENAHKRILIERYLKLIAENQKANKSE